MQAKWKAARMCVCVWCCDLRAILQLEKGGERKDEQKRSCDSG